MGDRKTPSSRASRARRAVKPQPTRTGDTRRRTTTLEIDETKLAKVMHILGTRTLRETVDRSFDEVLARDARARDIARLQKMEGLDLDKPDVMRGAWR